MRIAIRIIDLMNDNNFLTCMQNDDLEEFKKKYSNINELKNRFTDRTNKFILPLTVVIFYNAYKIGYHIAKLEGITYDDYLMTLNKYKISNDTKKKANIVKFILDTYVFHKLNNIDVGCLINSFAQFQCWNVIDFFHYHGYKANNKEEFMKHVPPYKLAEMIKFGYNTKNTKNSECLIKMIKNSNIPSKDIQKIENINGYEKYLFQFRDPILIDYYVTNETIKLNNKCMDYACQHLNFDVIEYLMTKNIQLTGKHLIILLKCQSGGRKRNFRRAGLRYLMRTMKKINHVGNYEERLINILKKNKDILDKLVNTGNLWVRIFKNDYFLIASYLMDNGFKIKLAKSEIIRNLKYYIENDNVESIKKIFELKILKPIEISEQSKFMDLAVLSKANNTVDYLYNILKMKCSRNVIQYRYYFTATENHYKDCINNLLKINYPFYEPIFKLACYSGNLEVVKLLYKKVKLSSIHIEMALINNKIKIVEFLLENKCRYSKKCLVDRILLLCRNYQKTSQIFKIIKYAIIKLKATASYQCLHLILKVYDRNLLEYINNNCEIKGLENMTIYHLIPTYYHNAMRRKHQRIKNNGEDTKNYNNIQYLHETMGVKIYNNVDEIDKIIKQLIYKDDYILLKYIADTIDYKFNINDMKISLDNICDINIIKYIESKGIIPTEVMFSDALFEGSIEIVKHLHDKYKYTVNNKQMNLYLCKHDPHPKILWFIIHVLGIKPTPYSIDILLRKARCFCTLHALIEILIKNVDGITQYASTRMPEIHIHGSNLWAMEILNNVDIIEYQPINDELVHDADIANVHGNDDFMWDNFGAIDEPRNDIRIADDIIIDDIQDDENSDDDEVVDNI